MRTVQTMQAELRASLDEVKRLKALADDEGQAFGAEEEQSLDAALESVEALEAEIAEEQARQVRLREKFGSVEGKYSGRSRAYAAPLREHGERRTTVELGRVLAEEDPSRGYRSPREFLLDVIESGRKGQDSERLRPLRATAGSDEQGGYSDPHGGYLVPETFMPQLLSITPEDDFTAGRVTQIPMTTPTVRMNARVDKNHSSSVSGGFTVSRRSETTEISTSRQTYEQITLAAHTLAGAAYATEEILVDSPVSFAALISAGFSSEFTSHLINERLNGTGVGEFEGIMNNPALVSVAKESGQAADTIVYQNVVKMRARSWNYQNAIWVGNHDIYPQLAQMSLDVGTGGSIVWQPSAREDRPDILLGRPLFFTEYAKTLGDKGDLVLVDWSQYLEGTYQGLQSAASIHVRFLNHEQAFKFWLRNDGRGWWRSALTPKNSTATLSPFVTLNARA